MDPVKYSKQLGTWLRAARYGCGLSAIDVERLSGGRFRRAALTSWERGDRPILAENFAQLAAFYGFPPAELLP